jgi:hypothetical protein
MRLSILRPWRMPMVVLVLAASVLAAGVGQAQANFCIETVNPAGKPAVGDNGFPNQAFGGDAVPGGRHTSPGTNGNGPINSDGFYLVFGYLFSDTTPIPYPDAAPGADRYFWPSDTTIKYTQTGKGAITFKSIGGPNSVIQYHIQAPGDLYVGVGTERTFCGVPPPPF